MSTARAIPTQELISEIGLRMADKPAVVPACRNCREFACDHDDRETWKGVTFHRTKIRCKKHGIRTTLNTVCNLHAFRYADRKDV